MSSRQFSFDQYNTDKITHQYLERYDPIFKDWIDKPVTLLELGVYHGGSLKLWRDYFLQGTIVGIDLHLPMEFIPGERIHVFEGSQDDTAFLTRISNQVASAGYDIIIDDASHLGAQTKIAFWHLFDHHLKPGGLYIIEDWGTGYWSDWPDGEKLDFASYDTAPPRKPGLLTRIFNRLGLKLPGNTGKSRFSNHSFGMVGVVKQLIDEVAASDVTRQSMKGTPQRGSKFESILVTPSIVFIRKPG